MELPRAEDDRGVEDCAGGEAEERLASMSVFDANYEDEKQAVMVLRARRDVAEGRRVPAH